jgi:hypothetical protein
VGRGSHGGGFIGAGRCWEASTFRDILMPCSRLGLGSLPTSHEAATWVGNGGGGGADRYGGRRIGLDSTKRRGEGNR